jgi:NADPH:quinone reductase-like Zn-dependent oxidoreductase
MRVVGQDALGGPETLRVVEIERPEPAFSRLQVEVHAEGLETPPMEAPGPAAAR